MAENYIIRQGEKGSVNISEEVIAVIAAAAVAEVDGVAGFSNASGTELAELLGKKSVSKGIKIQFADEKITVDTIINVRFGYKITEVAGRVQDSVCSAIEAMTAIKPAVNVHISGVAFDKQ